MDASKRAHRGQLAISEPTCSPRGTAPRPDHRRNDGEPDEKPSQSGHRIPPALKLREWNSGDPLECPMNPKTIGSPARRLAFGMAE